MTNGRNASRGHRHHHQRTLETQRTDRRAENDAYPHTLTAADVASTSTALASAIDERIQTSEDTMTLAAAVAASIPAAPLTPSPTMAAVPVAQVSPTQTAAAAAGAATETALAATETQAAPVERRGILQRLFGWN